MAHNFSGDSDTDEQKAGGITRRHIIYPNLEHIDSSVDRSPMDRETNRDVNEQLRKYWNLPRITPTKYKGIAAEEYIDESSTQEMITGEEENIIVHDVSYADNAELDQLLKHEEDQDVYNLNAGDCKVLGTTVFTPAPQLGYKGARYITSIMADYCFEDKFIIATLKEFFVYAIFYACLLFVTLYHYDCMTFQHNETIRRALSIDLRSETVTYNFFKITTTTQIWQFLNIWLNKRILLDINLYNKYKCGKEMEEEPVLLTSPRLSQVRATRSDCPVPPEMNSTFYECYGQWSKCTEETRPFGLKRKPGWVYEPDLDLNIIGNWDHYYGGGYSLNLRDETDFKNLYLGKSINDECTEGDPDVKGSDDTKLDPGAWIDDQTRAVFLEYNTYSPSTNYMTFVALIFEIPPNGFVTTSADIWTYHLFRATSIIDFMILALQVVILLLLFFFLYERIKELAYFRGKYFCTMWGIIELLLLLSGLIYYIITLLKSRKIKHELSLYIDIVCRGDFWPARNILRVKCWLIATNVANGIFIFLATIKLIKFLAVFESYSRILFLLKRVFCSLFLTMVALNLFLITFGLMGHLLFCQITPAFRTICQSLITSYGMLLGNLDYNELFIPCSHRAHWFIFSYYMLVLVFGVNFFRAVAIQGYADAICTYQAFCKHRCRIACPFPFQCAYQRVCKAPFICKNKRYFCDASGRPIVPPHLPECPIDFVPEGSCNRPPCCKAPCRPC